MKIVSSISQKIDSIVAIKECIMNLDKEFTEPNIILCFILIKKNSFQTTKELKLSKERFQDFAETVGDWFWEIDLQFNCTYLSRSKINSAKILSHNLFTLINDNSLISIIKSARTKLIY